MLNKGKVNGTTLLKKKQENANKLTANFPWLTEVIYLPLFQKPIFQNL